MTHAVKSAASLKQKKFIAGLKRAAIAGNLLLTKGQVDLVGR